MKIISNRLLLVAFMTFIFLVAAESTKSVYSQSKMMEADIHSPVSKEMKKDTNLPKSMPQEPLLFELDKNSPPSAMLRDQEKPDKSDTARLLRRAKKTEPYPMPSEPEPK